MSGFYTKNGRSTFVIDHFVHFCLFCFHRPPNFAHLLISKGIGPSTLEPTSLLLLTDRPLLLWPVRYQGSSKKAFNQISHYESLITNFLTYDEDKKRIQNQVESIQNLAKKIFRNMNFNKVRSEIVEIILPLTTGKMSASDTFVDRGCRAVRFHQKRL